MRTPRAFSAAAALAAAALLTSGVALPAVANDGPDREVLRSLSGDAFGIGQVTLVQYADTTRTFASLVTAIAPDEISADEWDLVLHRDLTCSDEVASYPFAFTQAYGPRINAFEPDPSYSMRPGRNQVRTAELVHEGPNFHSHAAMPGRHSVACIILGPDGR